MGGYLILVLFIILLFVTLSFVVPFNSTSFEWFFVYAVVITLLVCTAPISLYRTRYVVKNGRLSSKSIFAFINISTKEIARIEQTRIPFMLRGFGASLHSGWFYIPTVGWTRVIMTNLTDGVLIKTKDGKNYLITPSDPRNFVRSLKG